MNNDQKPGVRITVERVSVTTIRNRSKKVYCEICLRSLGAGEIHLAPPGTEPATRTAREAENEEGEIE